MNEDSVKDLRAAGYAVVIFNPDELCGVPPDRIEDIGIERMNNAISDLAEVEED